MKMNDDDLTCDRFYHDDDDDDDALDDDEKAKSFGMLYLQVS